MLPSKARPALPLVVLVSGQGSNLQAILDRKDAIGVDVRAVISDRAEAPALARALKAGVPVEVVAPGDHLGGEAYDRALAAAIDKHSPGLMVLAGFMRILGGDLVRRYHGRMLNIHPSLLPKYRGLHTHRRALEAKEPVHGCSVHFVIEELDSGAVVAQAEVPVKPKDTEATLRIRVQAREHALYPEVIGWYASGRLRLNDGRVLLDGAPLTEPKMFPWQEEG